MVFTEYATTLDWMVGILQQRGYGRRAWASSRAPHRPRIGRTPGPGSARTRPRNRSACWSPPTPPGEGIDLQAHCHRLVNFDIPFNPSRLEQRIGRIDRYGQLQSPEIFHFAPSTTSTTYEADMDFMRRIAEKVGHVAQDLGSVNQVIDAEVQEHFSPTRSRSAKAAVADGNAIITKTLAGGVELNRQLDGAVPHVPRTARRACTSRPATPAGCWIPRCP